jgi:hypothetical protein
MMDGGASAGAATAFSTVRPNPQHQQQGGEYRFQPTHQNQYHDHRHTHGNHNHNGAGGNNGALQSTSSFGNTYAHEAFDQSISTIRDASQMISAREQMMMNGSVRAPVPQSNSLNSV